MITICAWCQRLMGADPEDRLLLSHGICDPCRAVSYQRDRPLLVVGREHASLLPELARVLRESAIPVVLDRRMGQRRQPGGTAAGDERRKSADRRRRGGMIVC